MWDFWSTMSPWQLLLQALGSFLSVIISVKPLIQTFREFSRLKVGRLRIVHDYFHIIKKLS
jgi:hypothetical protein